MPQLRFYWSNTKLTLQLMFKVLKNHCKKTIQKTISKKMSIFTQSNKLKKSFKWTISMSIKLKGQKTTLDPINIKIKFKTFNLGKRQISLKWKKVKNMITVLTMIH